MKFTWFSEHLKKSLLDAITKYWKRTDAKPTKRICANCHQPIRKRERWSAVRWPDRQPRHWAPCPSQQAQQALGAPGEAQETALV